MLMNKIYRNQKGFGIVPILLILILVAIVGFTGYYVYNNNKKTDKNTTNQETSKTTTEDKNAGYLVINEWNVRVKLGSADPTFVTYKITKEPSTGYESVNLYLKEIVTSNTNCQSLGIVITRTKENLPPASVKIDDYYYGVGGSPASCNDAALDATRLEYIQAKPIEITKAN